MKKVVLLSIMFITGFVSTAYGMNQLTKVIVHEAAGMRYARNNFGDIFPQWQDIRSEDLTHKLSSFVNLLKDTEKNTPFFVEVPHEKASEIVAIKKAGFTFHYANNDRTEWIFKNNSSIPLPYTAVIGAEIFVRKNDDVFVIEEKTRLGRLGFPGGTAEFKEFARETAAREFKEEVGFEVDPGKLALFALINRINDNRFNANSVIHCYVVDHSHVSGEVHIDTKEINRAFYASLNSIAQQEVVEGLIVPPVVAALAKHLLNKSSQSYCKTFLDYRQLLKKESERDQTDTMTVEFFA